MFYLLDLLSGLFQGYDYEVYHNPLVDLSTDVLPYLEEAMLDHVATKMQLVACRRRFRRKRQLNRRQRRQEQEILDEDSSGDFFFSQDQMDSMDDLCGGREP